MLIGLEIERLWEARKDELRQGAESKREAARKLRRDEQCALVVIVNLLGIL